ncbi:uncharacterized protein L969DRAFT_152547 [Mixia osmundae IAM 14324]|uniref:PCI domain-containing protein n=1 Tax=Mixia osmundae (strain CBS 9802 / IAM 14324 / JCM 22182 / KY 12970) TaxID=764103 RepID=G7E370_MIXOS|nr:uncharacterized protein L969DRAFT_152547 [Mixia osmundae IAM 14324]KEI42460.1 hypothetical protein L969DRAFT_152547 [Mixia osmundae IAM 14324]GAA97251.1 hypothetical protein E5Q_03928 [Mixia osmundae IAM 14324]
MAAVHDDFAARTRLSDFQTDPSSVRAPDAAEAARRAATGGASTTNNAAGNTDVSRTAASAHTVLEPYLLLAKSARGAGLAQLTAKVTASPEIWFFSELLDMPSIRELAHSETHSGHHKLLEIFAYGTLSHYRQAVSTTPDLPKLDPAQEIKLKQLTLLSAASDHRVLPYSGLMKALELTSTSEVEDLIIRTIYAQVLSGRLDQARSRFLVDEVIGRDVRYPEGVVELSENLREWQTRIEATLGALNEQIDLVRKAETGQAEWWNKLEAQRLAAAHEVIATGTPAFSSGFQPADNMDLDLMSKERAHLKASGRKRNRK